MLELDFYIVIRFACAFLAGILMTWSGSLSQLNTRNLLASPTTLGIDAFAVLILLVSNLIFHQVDHRLIFFLSLVGISFVLFILIERYPHFFEKKNIILLGICFNLFVAAIFSCLQFFMMAQGNDFPSELWFGQFRWANQNSFLILLGLYVSSLFVLIKIQKKLSIMSLGPSLSRHFHVDEKKVLLISMIMITWMNSWIICFFGVFSFLGLLFPNIVRLIPYFRTSIKNELLLGPYWVALIFALCDQAVYWIDFKGSEVPVGVICSVIGAFLLIFLILQQQAFKER